MVKVFINPGHGANDSGAINPRLKLEERHIAKAIGLEVQKLLKVHSIDCELYQQQKSLNEVPKEANKSGASVFVSIHMNAPAVNNGGVEVLHCEGSVKGKELATTILGKILKIGDYTFTNRGIKNDANRHLCVLRQTKMTSCLIELGFITYNKEAQFINAHTEACARAIVEGIEEYLKNNNLWKPVSLPPMPKPIVTELPKISIKIEPSGKNDTFNLFIDNKIKLKENKLDTIHNFLKNNYNDYLT